MSRTQKTSFLARRPIPWKNLALGCYFLLCFFLLWPVDAWAWGPTVHTHLALQTLLQLAALSPALRHLLTKYPNDFIYGNLSADIILGKKYIDYYYHCHNWRVGMEVLENAREDSQRAFALGYLCHLAADVVAHNLFVPDKLVRSFEAITHRHTYWELRFDLRLDPELSQKAHRIAKFYHEKNDPLLEQTLRETLFSFKTNKRIFHGLLTLQKQGSVKKFMQGIAARSPIGLEETRAKKYMDLAQQFILDFLQKQEGSNLTQTDPAGHTKLRTATELRKKLRNLRQDGSMDEVAIQQIINSFHTALNDTLLDPQACPKAQEIIVSAT